MPNPMTVKGAEDLREELAYRKAHCDKKFLKRLLRLGPMAT